ncbi:MAG: hypothetical protein KGM99_16065 [Burkholderiales bacterium]|nr:hypothetical protein [Burkholderiales bacterium]
MIVKEKLQKSVKIRRGLSHAWHDTAMNSPSGNADVMSERYALNLLFANILFILFIVFYY